jgi:glycosyltransferase 2 family protein
VPARIKVILQYVVILLLTGLLIWFSLRGIPVKEGENKWDYLVQTWNKADKGWLWLMAFISMISHLLRAERWRMLLTPAGKSTTLGFSFLSLMVGYLVNLVIPRGGELSRCYNLYKLDKIPVELSFGTVVLERIVDLLCLAILIGLSFLLESQKLFAFMDTLPLSAGSGNSKLIALAYIAGIGLICFGLLYWLIIRNKKVNGFFKKTWTGFKEGLLSVFRLQRKGLFIFYSVGIWLLYFLMSYAVIKAFPATAGLGFQAVISLFAIGAIAMAAPLPGGTGSYHVLVPQGLVFLYGIPLPDAVAFTFIFHGWQTAILIVAGAISIIITSFVVKKKSQPH